MKVTAIFVGLAAVFGLTNGWYGSTAQRPNMMSYLPVMAAAGGNMYPFVLMSMMRSFQGGPPGNQNYMKMIFLTRIIKQMGEAGPAMLMALSQQNGEQMDPMMMYLLFQGNENMMSMLPFIMRNQQQQFGGAPTGGQVGPVITPNIV